MWEFYLAAVELEFLHGSHMVFQLLLSTKRDAVPILRDFMIDDERAAALSGVAENGEINGLLSPVAAWSPRWGVG